MRPSPVPTRKTAWLTSKQAVAIAYVVSSFMIAMDNHIVNVMLPTLSREYHAALPVVQWTVIGYVLSLAVFIPASAWLGDRFGTRRIFLLALAMFTAASALCGLAQSLPELVLFRVAQGVGGGMLTPVATSMLFRAYPPQERARMTRLLIVPILLGPVLAQPLGGLLVEKASWRWAFYLNVPIGIAAFVVSAVYMVEHREDAGRPFDLPGFLLGGVGLSLALYALSQGPELGWTSPAIIATGIVGVAALVAFTAVELRERTPLLRLTLLNDRIFRATNIVMILNTMAFSGLLFLAPVFLQEAKGVSPLSAGLTTFFTAVGVMVASQTVGRIYPWVGPRRMSAVGQAGLTLMLLAFLLIGAHASLWAVRGTLFLAGFANSATSIAVQTSMFSRISSRDTGSGSAILNAGRQSATAVGVAILTTVISTVPGTRLHAFHGAFIAAAVFAFAAAVAAIALIRDSDAAETMRPRAGVPQLASTVAAAAPALPVDVA